MTHVSLKEYEAAKAEIIGGVHYEEKSTLEGSVIRKTYTTEENGVFYEVNDGGRVEFWSDKHPESRIYDENERANSPAAETTAPAAELPDYGDLLAEKIRTTTQDFSKLTDFEKFVLDNGYKYKTEMSLKAGYDRAWKARHGIMLTAEEFAAECRPLYVSEAEYQPTETTAEVYDILSALVREEKLTPGDVFGYATHRWCLKNPEAIIAYQVDPYRESPIHRKWAVNNCSEEITEEAARVKVCEEFGFEASRVKIIGTPYYDATDWNFIRFDCAGWAWLMVNGGIQSVCH